MIRTNQFKYLTILPLLIFALSLKSQIEIMRYDLLIFKCRYSFVDSFQNGQRVNTSNTFLDVIDTSGCHVIIRNQGEFLLGLIDSTDKFPYVDSVKYYFITDVFNYYNSDIQWFEKHRYRAYKHHGIRKKFELNPYDNYEFQDSNKLEATAWYWKRRPVRIQIKSNAYGYSPHIYMLEYQIDEIMELKRLHQIPNEN